MAELPAYVDEVPQYSVRDGRMHIGIGPLGLVMPISIFEAGCIAGKTAIAKWYVSQLDDGDRVVPIRRG